MQSRTILIIEDEQPLLETLQIKLKKEGFSVETASNGKQGIEQARKVKPDLILLDLLLPEIKGEDVLVALKQDSAFTSTPVIIISNSGQPVEITKLLAAGADDYIIKANFTIDDILERVHNALEKKRGSPDVLLAEDENFLRTVLAKKLRMAGLRILTTVDGDTTLKTIHECKPKLLLLDLLMPGISGTELLETLKTDSSFDKNETKIVVLSNYSGKENDPIVREMTVGYFIKSNFDIDDIVDKVKAFVQPKEKKVF